MTESKLTKFSALFLALLTLLGTVFSVPVTAATGDKAVITFTYCYDSNGNKALERSISTAGKASRLVMSTSLIPTTSADGRYSDMGTATIDNEKTIFITVTMTDDNGRLVPTAQDNLRFEVSGAGEYVAACNGDATSLQSFTQPEMRLFNGQAVIVVRANEGNKGDIKVRATSLESGISKEISITRK